MQEDVPDTIILHGPEINPQEHKLTIYLLDSSGVSHKMERWGEVPLEFITLEGELTVTSTSGNSFEFNRTGQWDHFS